MRKSFLLTLVKPDVPLPPQEWVCIELTESFYRSGVLNPLPLLKRPGPPPDYPDNPATALNARQ